MTAFQLQEFTTLHGSHGNAGNERVAGCRDHRSLAQGGQHLADVFEKPSRRTHDQNTSPGEFGFAEKQIRHPVQRHDGLAGARPALHDQRAADRCAHDLVLLTLQGSNSRAHRPGTASR